MQYARQGSRKSEFSKSFDVRCMENQNQEGQNNKNKNYPG